MDGTIIQNRAEEVEKLIAIQKAEGLQVSKDDITFYVMQVYGGYYPTLLSSMAAGAFAHKPIEKPIEKKPEDDFLVTEVDNA